MKKALVGLLFAFASAAAWALPSEQDVQNAVKQGQYTQAQSMMAEVVGAKPENAKAHYIYAEVLAHNGVFNKAAEEAAKARQLDPAIKFTDPAKFRSFEETLQREQGAAANRSSRAVPTSTTSREVAPASVGGGVPGWVWLVGLVVLGYVLFRGFMRSRAAAGGVPPAAAGYGPGGMNQGYGPGGPGGMGGGYGPYGPGGAPGVAPRGGSLLGTGAAVAGGVAGGMLLDQMLHRHDGSSGGGGGFISDAQANPAAGELENRSIDFGSGNDWDSGGGGGGIDLGGGGGGDGGSWE
jgi:hypothetical protein